MGSKKSIYKRKGGEDERNKINIILKVSKKGLTPQKDCSIRRKTINLASFLMGGLL